ncbi:MAG: hypothetical protein ACE1ZP_00430, partial [Myxococcota bacterium]
TPKSLATLKILLGGAEPGAGKTYSAAEAEHLTGWFRRHYHHVVPFDRDHLDEIWDRCRGADCEKRRIHAEAEIGISHGEFDAQADGLSGRRDPERISQTPLSSFADPPTPPILRWVAR